MPNAVSDVKLKIICAGDFGSDVDFRVEEGTQVFAFKAVGGTVEERRDLIGAWVRAISSGAQPPEEKKP